MNRGVLISVTIWRTNDETCVETGDLVSEQFLHKQV